MGPKLKLCHSHFNILSYAYKNSHHLTVPPNDFQDNSRCPSFPLLIILSVFNHSSNGIWCIYRWHLRHQQHHKVTMSDLQFITRTQLITDIFKPYTQLETRLLQWGSLISSFYWYRYINIYSNLGSWFV